MMGQLLRIPTKDLRRLVHGLSMVNRSISTLNRKTCKSTKYLDEESKETLIREGSSHSRHIHRSNTKIPKGYLAVEVGPEMRRFVIPASYLSLPDFQVLMESVEEEFGFEQVGALKFPCEEEEFEDILISCHAKHRRKELKRQ
ncbi:hypothetical protein AQUCO_01800156v1 [Aquilegia coerulea]|uniref:Uncharacterized protein n=1 Tax=Aquilegia coerulea TaxID=218851 RepID=A0A2G5DK77_AQUCA|nr:hypothetical protein AQUCO_01800156v1 [Aquilegia coerulea]